MTNRLRNLNFLYIVLVIILSFVALSEQVLAGVNINTIDRGWYRNVDPRHQPANDNYATGFADGPLFFRSFFVFDLSSINDQICEASLNLYLPQNGYDSPDATETVTLYDVITNLSDLTEGSGGVAAFSDLAEGVSYGSTTVSESEEDGFVVVNLNNDGINALNAATGGQIAIGGHLTTIDQLVNDENIFADSSTGDPRDGNTFLNLEFCSSGPIVIIPTLSQWGMIIVSLLIGLFSVFTLRRTAES